MAWQSSTINPTVTTPADDISKIKNDLAVLRAVLGGGTDSDVPFPAPSSNFLQSGAGAVTRTAQSKMREWISVQDFGAVGDNSNDDTAEIQAAVTACPVGGTVYFPPGQYKLSDEIIIDKPMTIMGPGTGSFINDLGSWVRQSNTTKAAFRLKAATANYAFSQFGVVDVHFANIAIIGNSNASRSLAGVATDTTINSGNYHIRECSWWNVAIRYFTTGVDLTGICYLNDFFNPQIAYCGTGVKFARGAASDLGGQNRFFGGTIDLCAGPCVSCNEDTLGGSFSFFGCTLSESYYGIRANEEAVLTVMGCELEALTNSGGGAGIYIPIADSNPNSSGTKTIIGNKFLSSDADIWINKTTTAFSGGGFTWPMKIDGNYLGSASALKITVPSGHAGIDSQAFVLGDTNAGTNNGLLASSQISPLFFGNDQRRRRITKRITFTAPATGTLLDMLPTGMVLQTVRYYLTANATTFTGLKLGDQSNDQRFGGLINAQTQALNTWITYSSTLGDVIDSTRNNLKITFTAGAPYGCAGVIEIDGYLS